jgi:DDE superfamily endonuclease
VQEKAWMDTASMHKWIDKIYAPWATAINGRNIVLLDLGPAHAKTEIVDRIAEFHEHFELLPPHSTSVLQVMDVGINKPFKNAVKNHYDMWFVENADEENPKPRRPDVAKWIAAAWSQIRDTTILRTWAHIGWTFENNDNHNDANNSDDDIEDGEDGSSFEINEDDEFMQVRSAAESYGSDDDDNYKSLEDDEKSEEEEDFEAQFR